MATPESACEGPEGNHSRVVFSILPLKPQKSELGPSFIKRPSPPPRPPPPPEIYIKNHKTNEHSVVFFFFFAKAAAEVSEPCRDPDLTLPPPSRGNLMFVSE